MTWRWAGTRRPRPQRKPQRRKPSERQLSANQANDSSAPKLDPSIAVRSHEPNSGVELETCHFGGQLFGLPAHAGGNRQLAGASPALRQCWPGLLR